MPIAENGLALHQPGILYRLRPDQRALLGVPGLGVRLHRLPAVKVDRLRVGPGVGVGSAQEARGVQDIGPGALRRPYGPAGEQQRDGGQHGAKEDHAHGPRREARDARRHGARVDADDAQVPEAGVGVGAPLQLKHHHEQAQLGRAVAPEPAAERRVFLGRAPGALCHGLDAGLVAAHDLLVLAFKRLAAVVALITRAAAWTLG